MRRSAAVDTASGSSNVTAEKSPDVSAAASACAVASGPGRSLVQPASTASTPTTATAAASTRVPVLRPLRTLAPPVVGDLGPPRDSCSEPATLPDPPP